MGIFKSKEAGGKGTNAFRTGGGGNWGKPGRHRVRITKTTNKEEGYKGHSVIVEYAIVRSDNPECKVDQEFSQVSNITKHKEMALGNVADFVRAALQTLAVMEGDLVATVEEVEFTDEDSDYIFGVEGPMVGKEMDLYIYMKKTNAGGDFSVHVWSAPKELIDALQQAA